MIKDRKRTKKAGVQKGLKPQLAISFEVNPYYEQLLEIREKKPAAYRLMSTATRLAVEAYVRAKEAASDQNVRKAAA